MAGKEKIGRRAVGKKDGCIGFGEGDILGGRQFGVCVNGWLKGLVDKPVFGIPEISL